MKLGVAELVEPRFLTNLILNLIDNYQNRNFIYINYTLWRYVISQANIYKFESIGTKNFTLHEHKKMG